MKVRISFCNRQISIKVNILNAIAHKAEHQNDEHVER